MLRNTSKIRLLNNTIEYCVYAMWSVCLPHSLLRTGLEHSAPVRAPAPLKIAKFFSLNGKFRGTAMYWHGRWQQGFGWNTSALFELLDSLVLFTLIILQQTTYWANTLFAPVFSAFLLLCCCVYVGISLWLVGLLLFFLRSTPERFGFSKRDEMRMRMSRDAGRGEFFWSFVINRQHTHTERNQEIRTAAGWGPEQGGRCPGHPYVCFSISPRVWQCCFV